MSTSLIEIFNLALSACGSDLSVSDPDEQSREADLCRLWYPRTRDALMKSAPWPCLRAYQRLALSVEREDNTDWAEGDPAPRWRFAYLPPSDMLIPYRLDSYAPFEYQRGRLSMHEEQPILYYNRRETNPALWDEGLTEAMYHYLAAKIARPLTASRAVIEENISIAQGQIEAMTVLMANSDEQRQEDLPDWLQVRGTTIGTPAKFFYPMSSINTEAST